MGGGGFGNLMGSLGSLLSGNGGYGGYGGNGYSPIYDGGMSGGNMVQDENGNWITQGGGRPIGGGNFGDPGEGGNWNPGSSRRGFGRRQNPNPAGFSYGKGNPVKPGDSPQTDFFNSWVRAGQNSPIPLGGPPKPTRLPWQQFPADDPSGPGAFM